MTVSGKDINLFKKEVWNFYKKSGRVLPWRVAGTNRATKLQSYKILLSEFMLQQTQVPRVLIKFAEFIKLFPTMESLALATQKDVISVWQGLGYNRRALYLKRTAEILVKEYQAIIPQDPKILESFPGIGPYTARAIAAFAYNAPYTCIETNFRTVFIHHFFAGREEVDDREILALIEKTIDTKNPRHWYYALMDYGSFLKKTVGNANIKSKHYTKQSVFKGSRREARGKILKYVVANGKISLTQAIKLIGESSHHAQDILADLVKDGFLEKKKSYFFSI